MWNDQKGIKKSNDLMESNYVWDIQKCFKCIIKKHETLTNNLPIQVYVDSIENRITFKIKSEHYLKLLTSHSMKPLTGTDRTIDKEENWQECIITRNWLINICSF